MQFSGTPEWSEEDVNNAYEKVFSTGVHPFENIFHFRRIINMGYPYDPKNDGKEKRELYEITCKLLSSTSDTIAICPRKVDSEILRDFEVIKSIYLSPDLILNLSDRYEDNPHDACIFPIDCSWGICIDHYIGFIWVGCSRDVLHSFKESIGSDLHYSAISNDIAENSLEITDELRKFIREF